MNKKLFVYLRKAGMALGDKHTANAEGVEDNCTEATGLRPPEMLLGGGAYKRAQRTQGNSCWGNPRVLWPRLRYDKGDVYRRKSAWCHQDLKDTMLMSSIIIWLQRKSYCLSHPTCPKSGLRSLSLFLFSKQLLMFLDVLKLWARHQ